MGIGGSSYILREAELPGRRRIEVDDIGPLDGDGGDPLLLLVDDDVVVVVVVSWAQLLEASVSESVMMLSVSS